MALLGAIAGIAHAQCTGGYTGAVNDASTRALQKAQTEALQAYARCLQTTNDASKCGPPPQVNAPQFQQPQQQQVQVTDYGCVDGNVRGGQTFANAMSACTH